MPKLFECYRYGLLGLRVLFWIDHPSQLLASGVKEDGDDAPTCYPPLFWLPCSPVCCPVRRQSLGEVNEPHGPPGPAAGHLAEVSASPGGAAHNCASALVAFEGALTLELRLACATPCCTRVSTPSISARAATPPS